MFHQSNNEKKASAIAPVKLPPPHSCQNHEQHHHEPEYCQQLSPRHPNSENLQPCQLK